MSLAQKTIRGLKWQAVEVVGRQLLGLVVFTTLARLLDPAAFGLVGMVGVYLAFVGMFVDQGIGTALIQRKDLQPDHLHTAFWFNLGCAAVMCGGTMALAGPVALLFAEPRLEPLIRWASLGLVLGALGNIHSTVFMRNMDFKRPAMRMLIAQLAGGGVGVTMALLDYGVWALVGQQLIAALAGTIFLWIASTYRPQCSFSVARLRELLGVSSAMFSTSFFWFFSSRTDSLMIGRFIGTEALGLYTIALRLTDLTKTVLFQPIASVMLPGMSSVQDDRPRLRQVMTKAVKASTVITFPSLIGLACVAPDLIRVLFGEKWVPATPALQALCVYLLVHGVQDILHYALVAAGEAKMITILGAAHAVGVVIAVAVCVPWGIFAVPLGLAFTSAVLFVARLVVCKRRLDLGATTFVAPACRPLLAATAMGAGILGLSSLLDSVTPLARLSVVIFSGAILYGAVLASLDLSLAREVFVQLRGHRAVR